MNLYNKIAIAISLGLLVVLCVTESIFAWGLLLGWFLSWLGIIAIKLWQTTRKK